MLNAKALRISFMCPYSAGYPGHMLSLPDGIQSYLNTASSVSRAVTFLFLWITRENDGSDPAKWDQKGRYIQNRMSTVRRSQRVWIEPPWISQEGINGELFEI